MDEPVIKYYRNLMRTNFEHTGSLENPQIFLDSVGEKIRICGHNTYNYLHIYIQVINQRIENIKYLCTCDPAANVAVELFCTLVKGKTLLEAQKLTPDLLCRAVGSTGAEFRQKATGLLELFKRGLEQYRASLLVNP
jgi:NifU-like protein involved in Fe-S cluster formation